MFPKKHKLTLRSEFQRVYKYKQVVHTRYFMVYKVLNQSKVTRFALIVANKVSQKAVDRNKIKRRLRSVILKNLDFIYPGYDVIINVKPVILGLDFKTTEKELILAISKAKLRCLA